MKQKVVINFRGQVTSARQRDEIRNKIIERTGNKIKAEDITFKY